MMGKKIFKSDAFAAIHASAKALYKDGAIDEVTMRYFEAESLTAAPEFTAADTQKLRQSHR